MRILGIDPGLQKTGWGIIEAEDNRLRFITCGTIKTDSELGLPERLAQIDTGMQEILAEHTPTDAAIASAQPAQRRIASLTSGSRGSRGA